MLTRSTSWQVDRLTMSISGVDRSTGWQCQYMELTSLQVYKVDRLTRSTSVRVRVRVMKEECSGPRWIERFARLRRFQVTGKMWTPTFFPFLVTNTNGHPGKLSIMTSCILIFVSLSTCQPCRPVYRVELVNLSTCLPCRPVYVVDLSTLSIYLPCQPVYLVNLSTCQLVILYPVYLTTYLPV